MAGRSNYDILSSLPLELVVQIVEYLDVTDIIRCQKVSKQWAAIFTTDTIIKRFLPRALELLGLDTTNVATADAKSYIRWLDGIQSSRPVRKVFLPMPGLLEMAGDILYHSRRLFYIMSWPKKIAMLDLETGEKSIWSGVAKKYLQGLALSDRWLITRTAKSTMVAWDVRTLEPVAKALFPAVPGKFTIAKDKVVIVHCYPLFHVSVWDLRSNHVHTFGSFSHLYLWHADADEDVLVAFEINWVTDPYPPRVQQTKWTLTGELLYRKQFRFPVGSRRMEWSSLRPHHDELVRTYGHKSVTQFYSEKDPNLTLHIIYDHSVGNLSLRWIDCVRPINQLTIWGRGGYFGPHIAFRWAHQLRGVAIYNAVTGTTTVHPYQLDSREVNTRKTLGAKLAPPRRPIKDVEFTFSAIRCFGDSEVWGLVTKDGLQLWFFNPEFVPDIPGGEPFLAMEESG